MQKGPSFFAVMAGLSLPSVVTLHAQTNRPSGTVVTWGKRIFPDVEPGTRFMAIAAGALALKIDRSVVAWVDNVWEGVLDA